MLPLAKAEPSPISARIRAPVRGPMPGMDASSSPKGWARNASSISAARASRRAQTRSSSPASSAMTRPVAASAGTVTSWAARARDRRGDLGGDPRRAGLDGPLDAGLAGGAQRGQRRVLHQQVADPGLAQPLAEGPFQGRGDAGQRVAQPVGQPGRVGGQVDVEAVETRSCASSSSELASSQCTCLRRVRPVSAST